MNDELPPAFRELRDQFREAAARDVEIETRVAQRLGRGRLRLLLLGCIVAIVSSVGVAIAQRVLDHEGKPRPQDRLPRTVSPAADPGVIKTSATPDPDGGPPWALRIFTNSAGLECVAVARLVGDTLGTYSASHTFNPLPASVSGACEHLADSPLLVTVQRRADPKPRTIVYGLARDRRPVRITIAGTTRTVTPGALGSFITVQAGLADMRGAHASTTVAGRVIRRPIGAPDDASR